MNKWSNLPNAKHIDWIIQSVKDNPNEWDEARDAARGAAWAAARDAAWAAAFSAARDAAWDAATGAAWGAARGAAWGAVLAVVAYDDIEHYLFSSYEELRVIACLSQHPAAILLLPAVKARELIISNQANAKLYETP